MTIDKELEFSSGQVLTATANATKDIDQGSAGDSLADGDLFLVVRCGTLLDSAGEGSTLTVSLQTDDNAAFSSPTTVWTAPVIAEAAIVGNTNLIRVRLPLGLERYLRLVYTVGVENFTTGTVDAFITTGIDTQMP